MRLWCLPEIFSQLETQREVMLHCRFLRYHKQFFKLFISFLLSCMYCMMLYALITLNVESNENLRLSAAAPHCLLALFNRQVIGR
jgi:hypothetical protein